MTTIEIKAYSFDELSESAKDTAREWWRRGQWRLGQDGYNQFSESVIEDAEQCAELIGIAFAKRDYKTRGVKTLQKPCVYFSGFSSQGDGACFEGNWRAADVKPGKLKEHAPQDAELHRIAAEFERLAAKYPQASFSVKHSGHYSHKGCTDFDVEMFGEETPDIADNAETDKEMDALIKVARDFMEWIYRQLEKEYEYQNADEQVDETIRINDYLFTEDGKRTAVLNQ